MQTPVLFLVFKRPDTTRQVFEVIRAARPPYLYVAADGPRSQHLNEAELCKEVREIAAKVDWPCEVKTLFRDKNLGCRRAVSGALDWFFENEEYGIILEDDCLPSLSWFVFAEEMLMRFKDDERIMCVSATHFHLNQHQPEYSYFFSRYNHCWGWASWRRAWRYYDHEMVAWPKLKNTDWLLAVGDGNRLFQRYWTEVFDIAYEDKHVDSWAYRWTFSCWSQSGITILPAKNLVSNIGFGDLATHTKDDTILALPLELLDFPLRHPAFIVREVRADGWSDKHLYGITYLLPIKQIIKNISFIRYIFGQLKKFLKKLGNY